MAYNGLVPISPYIIPIAPKERYKRYLIPLLFFEAGSETVLFSGFVLIQRSVYFSILVKHAHNTGASVFKFSKKHYIMKSYNLY